MGAAVRVVIAMLLSVTACAKAVDLHPETDASVPLCADICQDPNADHLCHEDGLCSCASAADPSKDVECERD
jgi:hypothetical protein